MPDGAREGRPGTGPPPAEPCRPPELEQLRLAAHAIRRALPARPALVAAAVRRPPRQEATLHGLDAGPGLLLAAGLDPEAADQGRIRGFPDGAPTVAAATVPAMTSAMQSTAQPTPPPRAELRRSGTDKMLGGVCGGLATYSGIDVLLWRVGAVALALTGAGVLLYLLLWVLMPPAPAGPDTRTNVADRFVERLHHALTGPRSASRR